MAGYRECVILQAQVLHSLPVDDFCSGMSKPAALAENTQNRPFFRTDKSK